MTATQARTEQTRTQPVKSADRTLALIDLISSRGTCTFTEVMEALDLPRSSAHGLVQTLLNSRWLEQHPVTRRLSLGLHAWQVAQRYDGHRLLTEKAKPVMDDLAVSSGETVQLARLDGVENVYIAISPSPNPMRLASSVGMRLHAHATGIGKALLSTIDPADAEQRLSRVALPRLTARTEVEVPALLRIIDRARHAGFAVDDEEYLEGCRCVAVPLTTEAEIGISSALSITMPTVRTKAGWPHSMYAPLSAAARTIRAELGLTS